MNSSHNKESSAGHSECHQCNHHHTVQSTQQTLDEMEFERGIWQAVLNREISNIRHFIINGKTMDRDNYDYTALHYAARAGDFEICKMLILEGQAEINAITKGGATPLHRAATMGHLKIVKLLIEHSANVELQDNDGQTALHRAAIKNHQEMCEYLIMKNPNLKSIVDNKQKMAWEYLKYDANEYLHSLLKPSENILKQ